MRKPNRRPIRWRRGGGGGSDGAVHPPPEPARPCPNPRPTVPSRSRRRRGRRQRPGGRTGRSVDSALAGAVGVCGGGTGRGLRLTDRGGGAIANRGGATLGPGPGRGGATLGAFAQTVGAGGGLAEAVAGDGAVDRAGQAAGGVAAEPAAEAAELATQSAAEAARAAQHLGVRGAGQGHGEGRRGHQHQGLAHVVSPASERAGNRPRRVQRRAFGVSSDAEKNQRDSRPRAPTAAGGTRRSAATRPRP
jgi:hypothetical protein